MRELSRKSTDLLEKKNETFPFTFLTQYGARQSSNFIIPFLKSSSTDRGRGSVSLIKISHGWWAGTSIDHGGYVRGGQHHNEYITFNSAMKPHISTRHMSGLKYGPPILRDEIIKNGLLMDVLGSISNI